MPTPTGKTTRAERLAQPLTHEVAGQVAAEPVVESDPPTEQRQGWVEQRAMVTAERDRLAWVLDDLSGNPTNDGQGDENTLRLPVLTSVNSGEFAWELAHPTDPDVAPREQRLLRVVGEALKRRPVASARRLSPVPAPGMCTECAMRP